MPETQVKAIVSVVDKASRELSKISDNISNFGKKTNFVSRRISEGAQTLGSDLKRMGMMVGAAFAGVGIGAIAMGKGVLKSAADLEQNKIAFETMLGSAEKANKLLKDITDFAIKTPFTLPQVQEGTRQLLAYGFTQEEVLKQMRMLGDIAAGVNVPLGDMVYIYGTLRSQGRAYTRDIMQFTMRGIPLVEELARVFNVSEKEVKDLVEEGKVGFPEVEKALENMTGKGGRFGNLMEKQSRSLSGIISNLQDSFIKLSWSIAGVTEEGEIVKGGFFDVVKDASIEMQKFLDENRDLIKRAGAAIGEFFVQAVKDLLPLLKNLLERIKEINWVEFRERVKEVAEKISDFTGKIWGLIEAVVKFVSQHPLLSKILGVILAIVGTAVLFNPLIVVFGLVIAQVVLLANHMVKTWNRFKEFVDNSINRLNVFLQFVKNIFGSIAGIIFNSTHLMKDVIGSVWKKAEDVFHGIWDRVGYWIGKVILTTARGVNIIKSIFGGIWQSVESTFYGVWDRIKYWIGKAGLTIARGIEIIIRIFNRILDKANQLRGIISILRGGGGGGGWQKGLAYVPETGLYYLHRGERVVPAGRSGGAGATININLGGVSVYGEADENRLVEKIKNTLNRELELNRLGV